MPPVTVANPAPSMTTAATGKTGAVLPFTTASWDHEEPFYDNTVTLTTSSQNVGPVPVSAFGWMKGIWLRVTATGGSSSSAVVASGDGPWDIISSFQLQNPNGQPYVGPFGGFNLAAIRRFGSYWWADNPLGGIFSNIQTASGSGAGNFDLFFYIPAQLVDRNALGSLANENAKATYQMSWILNPSTTVYSTVPNQTLPSIRFRAYLQAWAAPPPQDILGNMTAQVPPGNGTIQFWTSNGANPTALGQYNLIFTRKGQYIRTWIFIVRNSNSPAARDSTCLTDPIQIRKDGYIQTQLTVSRWEEKMVDWYGLGQTGLTNDTRPSVSNSQWNGVYVYPFTNDLLPRPGAELRSRYYPTLQATRLELVDTFAAGGGSNAPTVEILTNDVAVPGDIFSRVLL